MTTNFNYPPKELEDELIRIAKALIAPGKGILVADEEATKIGIRLAEIGCKNTEEKRRQYREVLFTNELKLNDYISGCILAHEAAFQTTTDGTPFHELLKTRGIIPGIKVDSGTVPLYGSIDECTTQGLDDLFDRCAEYKKIGFEFAKWRCSLKIGPHKPSYQAVIENANVLARFASICQSQGIVPIIEAEVSPEGDHDIELALKATEVVYAAVFKSLHDHHVFLEGIILRSHMVTPGLLCKMRAKPEEIAIYTITALRRTVPPAVPGIVFLTGSQTAEEASINLNAINQVPITNPWILTFAFGQALQATVFRTWKGKKINTEFARNELVQRAKANSEAALGKYVTDVKGPAINVNLFSANHA